MAKFEVLSRRVRNGERIETKVAKEFHLKLVHLTWDAETKKHDVPELPSRFVEIKSSKNDTMAVRIGDDQLPVLQEKEAVVIFVDRATGEGFIVMATDIPSASFRFRRLKDGSIKIWGRFSLK